VILFRLIDQQRSKSQPKCYGNILHQFIIHCDGLDRNHLLDHDRFSRSLPEALSKIDQLQKKFGVKVLSVAEPLSLDTSDPNVFLNRAFKYLLANHELLNIRKRTSRGIRQAMESGRVVNNAPYGYLNGRDDQNKPILKVDAAKAIVVRKLFEQFVAGVPLMVLRKNANSMGCPRPGHSSMIKLLKNCLYAGLIRLPAQDGKPERIIKALHEPIIPESVYWLTQEILNGRPGQKSRPKDEFPLRGILRCDCGAHMTAGYTKGRSKYYLYYQCTKEKGRSYKGEIIHELVENLLEQLSFSAAQVVKIHDYAKEELSKAINFKTLALKAKQKEFSDVCSKILKLEEKMINDQIEAQTYKVWFSKLSGQKSALERGIAELKNENRNVFQQLDDALPILTNLKTLYNATSLEGKHLLLKTGFEVGISYDGSVLRTASINPALVDNYLKIKEKRLLIVEQPDAFLLNSYSCTA